MAAINTLAIDMPPNGHPCWVVRPLFITRHNLALVLAPGVVVLAKQDEFHGNYDSLLTVEGAHNISILGRAGSALRMRRADYALPWAPEFWGQKMGSEGSRLAESQNGVFGSRGKGTVSAHPVSIERTSSFFSGGGKPNLPPNSDLSPGLTPTSGWRRPV